MHHNTLYRSLSMNVFAFLLFLFDNIIFIGVFPNPISNAFAEAPMAQGICTLVGW